MTKRPVTHRAVFRHICENLDQDFDSPACREIRRHVEGCDDCVAYLNSLKSTVELYRGYPAPGLSRATRRSLRALLRRTK